MSDRVKHCGHIICDCGPGPWIFEGEAGRDLLKQLNNLSISSFETRPWGNYKVLYSDNKCKIKIITVNPGQRLSLQSHKHRNEHWRLISGEWEVELHRYHEKETILDILDGIKRDGPYYEKSYKIFSKVGDNAYWQEISIWKNDKHRVKNIGTEPLVFIEIQTGDSFDENDIVRYEDDFGRV